MGSITWDKFKVFFRKFLEDSWAFVNNYQVKIKQNSQYQLEKALDLAPYLDYLQAVLKKFNPTINLNKETLI